MSRKSSRAERGKQTRGTENNQNQLSTEYAMEEREGKENDHTNSQTRRTRDMENVSTRGGLSEGRQEGRKRDAGREEHCYIYRHRMWVVGVELAHKLRG